MKPETTAPPATAALRLGWLPLVALLAGLLVLPWQALLSRPQTDALQRLLASADTPRGIVLVDIDDASLRQLQPDLGPWPFKRDAFALVIEHLRDAGARAVVIDVLLADSREGDAALARTLARAGPPVLLAAAGLPPTRPGDGPDAALRWAAVVEPAATLDAQPAQQGIVTAPLHSDGRLRQVQLWHESGGRRWPAMQLRLWQVLEGAGQAEPRWPQDAQGRVSVALPRCTGCLPSVPFARLWRAALQGDDAALAGQLRGQVVVVGSSAVLVDRAMTVHGQVSGAEALALSYAALRDGQWLRPAPVGLQALLLLMALLPALWPARWAARQGPPAFTPALRAAAVLALLLPLLAALLQGQARIEVPLAAPAAALAAGAAALALMRQRWQQRERQRLDQARAVAAAANEAKTVFLANMSHEIRTPLNAVLGAAELLAATPLSASQRRHVAVFQQAGELLSDLINDLLDLTKIEAGKLELQSEPFELRPLLQRVVELLRARAAQKGLTLELQLAPGLPQAVLADRRRLQQALNNLVGNAIKFTAQGSVRLGAAPAGDGRVRFEVADTGIGIAASKVESIFEPFVQADGSITRNYGGTGLGLAITRSVVQLMGGWVEVRSVPGQGSVFTIELPLPQAALPPALQPLPAAPGARRSRVLLAEDNEANAYIFLAMLEGRGLRIDTAVNGLSALQMACERRYGVIFMDVQMPGMDGLQATAALRRHEHDQGLARTPVVALTAHSFADDVQRCLEAGCDHHLAKPFSRAQLLDLLDQLLPPPDEAGSPSTLPAPLGDLVPPVIDHDVVRARLGDDAALHQRVLDHAAVFLTGWQQAFDTATLQQQDQRRRALAHDLRGIAGTVGAGSLEAAALQLEHALGPDEPVQAELTRACEAVHDALGPVVVALARQPQG